MYDLVYRPIQHIVRFLWHSDVVEDHSDKAYPSSSNESYQNPWTLLLFKQATSIPETSGFASGSRIPVAV